MRSASGISVGLARVGARIMMHAKHFSVVEVGLGVMVFAFGSTAASAQTSPGTTSLAVVQQPPGVSLDQQLSTTRGNTVTVYTTPTL
jgi:hypothetical protein